jgi:hypothetical protein
MAKDLFNREDTNRRVITEEMAMTFKMRKRNLTGTEGVILNHGQKWQEQRRFMLHTLRDFGFGKSDMEGMINEEVSRFIEEKLNENGSDQQQIGVSNFILKLTVRTDHPRKKLCFLNYKPNFERLELWHTNPISVRIFPLQPIVVLLTDTQTGYSTI